MPIKRNRFSPRLLALALSLVVLTTTAAYAQTGGFDLSWFTIDGGGATFSSGGGYRLGGTIGQPDAGNLNGGAYTLQGGFWPGARLRAIANTPTLTATSTATNIATASATPSPTSTASTTAIATMTPGATLTGTAIASATTATTNTPTLTATSTASNTPTRSATATNTAIGTATTTILATGTRTITATASATNTATVSSTASGVATFTHTVTRTSTTTATRTATASATRTATLTATRTASATATSTATATAPVFHLENVTWIDDFQVAIAGNGAANNSITRANIVSSWTAGATSNRAIASGVGYTLASIGHNTDSVIFGLGNGDDDQSGYDIDFGIYFNGATHMAQTSEFNGLKGPAISFTPADSFKVAVETTGTTPVVDYYKNGLLFYTNASPILSYPLRLDSALYNPGAAITNAVIAGYNLTVVSGRGSGAAGSCSAVDWNTDPGKKINVTLDNPQGSIQKTSGANNTWNAGDSSVAPHSVADAPLSVQAVVNSSADNFIIGFTQVDTNTTPANTIFGLYGYGATGLLKVAYKGTVATTIGAMAPGDVIRVEYNATQARFYNNNQPLLVITYPGGNQFFPTIVDSTFYNTGAKLNNVQICSGGPDPTAKTADLSNVPHITVGQQQQLLNVNFSDVQASDYYYDAVQHLASHGAASGYSDGTFRPFAPVTRGQLTKVVVVAADEPLHNPANATFRDVAANNPFYQYIETAVWLKIVNGYSDNTFRPNNAVTRGQLAKMVVLGMSIPLDDIAAQQFSDVSMSNPFYTFIATALQRNMISGYAGGAFRPGASATRAQIAKIIYQAATTDRLR